MNKKSLIISVVFVVAVIFCLGAFESLKPADDDDGVFYFRQFEDAGGEKASLTKRPKKVAVLSSDLAEIWVTAGGKVAITVGETVQKGICSEDVLLVDSATGEGIDTEKLISGEPDFVIYSADSETQCKAAEELKKKKIPCAGMSTDSEEDYMETIMLCALLLENEDNTEQYIKALSDKIEAVK